MVGVLFARAQGPAAPNGSGRMLAEQGLIRRQPLTRILGRHIVLDEHN